MSRLLPALFGIAVYLTAQYAGAEAYGSGWYGEVQLSLGHEDNVPRAYADADMREDVISTASLGAGYVNKLGRRLHYEGGGYVSYSHHRETGDLSSTAISLENTLIWQPGSSWQGPWFHLTGDFTRIRFENSSARDGNALNVALGVNRRLGMRATARAGFRYLDYSPDGGIDPLTNKAVFDIERREWFAGADIMLGQGIHLTVDVSRANGDLAASSTTPSRKDNYAATVRDPALDHCTDGSCPSFYVYRFPADIAQIEAGILFNVFSVDLEFSATRLKAKGKDGLTYRDHILRVGVIRTF